jgi:hypothetical protein
MLLAKTYNYAISAYDAGYNNVRQIFLAGGTFNDFCGYRFTETFATCVE